MYIVYSKEPTDLTNTTTGETVKKFISTILPGEREEMVPSPFPSTVHLITSISCIPQVGYLVLIKSLFNVHLINSI